MELNFVEKSFEEYLIEISVGFCPVCGQLNIWKDCRECVSGDCDWVGEPKDLMDTYEEYLNQNRYNKLKDIL